MPSSLGSPWVPPKRAYKSQEKIQSPETVDPQIANGTISLAESIDFALKNNPNTSISWAQLQASIAELGLAREEFFPKIGMAADVTRTRRGFTFPPDGFINQWLTSWGPQLTVNYTLWDFGTRAARSESALQALFAMAWSYNQQIQTLVQTITNDYYNNLYQKAALANDEQDIKDALLVLEAAEKKLKVGVGDISQLVQAKTSYLQSQVNFVDQKDLVAASLIQLATDMGMPGNTQFSTQVFPSELPGKNYIAGLDTLIDMAIEQRPDILQSKANVKSAKSAVNEARLDYLPKIEGSVDVNYRSYNDHYPRHLDYTGQFQVVFPFFEGFHYRNKIRQAKANLNKAVALLKQQQDTILQQVTLYFTNYQNAIERVDYSAAFLDSALEEFDVTLANYKAGTGDIINVVQAQSALSDARSKYTLSVRDLFISLTNLAYATGSLIAPASDAEWNSIYQFEGGFNE